MSKPEPAEVPWSDIIRNTQPHSNVDLSTASEYNDQLEAKLDAAERIESLLSALRVLDENGSIELNTEFNRSPEVSTEGVERVMDQISLLESVVDALCERYGIEREESHELTKQAEDMKCILVLEMGLVIYRGLDQEHDR